MTGTNLAQDLKGTSLLCAVVWCVDSMVVLVLVLVGESNPCVRISGLVGKLVCVCVSVCVGVCVCELVLDLDSRPVCVCAWQ